jgi:hypothetical protein
MNFRIVFDMIDFSGAAIGAEQQGEIGLGKQGHVAHPGFAIRGDGGQAYCLVFRKNSQYFFY